MSVEKSMVQKKIMKDAFGVLDFISRRKLYGSISLSNTCN